MSAINLGPKERRARKRKRREPHLHPCLLFVLSVFPSSWWMCLQGIFHLSSWHRALSHPHPSQPIKLGSLLGPSVDLFVAHTDKFPRLSRLSPEIIDDHNHHNSPPTNLPRP